VRALPLAFRVALILLGFALVLFVGIRLTQIAGARIIASGRAPNGVEFFVVQRFNWDLGERFTTGFHYRTTNGVWGWCYYSHQDSLWSPADAIVQFDEKSGRATILRDGRPDISFDWETQFYQRGSRSNLASQSLQPGGAPPSWWSPGLLKP
jgi:hypothetical protein